MKALKRPLSMLLALLMCFGVFSGMNITAFAAGEEMTTYLVDLPRSADPQKAGWDHPALNLMGGWTVDAGDHFTVHAQDSFNGRAVYCIEPGVGVHTGDKYQGRDETFWDNYWFLSFHKGVLLKPGPWQEVPGRGMALPNNRQRRHPNR